jgi:hypothetical protein
VRPYLEKNLHKKMAGGVAQGVGPEFKPQCLKKKKYNPKNKRNKTKTNKKYDSTSISFQLNNVSFCS